MIGNLKDYEVVITLVAKDDTAKGARSSVSTIDRYALQAARAADQRALSSQNSMQRMAEAERRHAMQLARDKEQYAQRVAMAETRYAQASARDQARYAQQAARDKERSAQQSSRELVRWQERANREQLRLYEQNVKAFERAERERVRAAERAESEMERQRSRSSQQLRRTGRNIGVGGAVLTAAVTRPIVGFAEEAVSRFASYDAQVKGLEALYQQQGKVTDAAEATRKKLAELREVAKLPGLGFREAIEGQVRLQAVGNEADRATRILAGFGRAVATTGGGKNELDRITVQLAQMQSKGKVTMADLRPILEAAPMVGEAIKKIYGTIDGDALRSRGVTPDKLIDALLVRFKELPPLTGSLKNNLENLTDSWDVFLISVGKAMTDIPAVNRILFGASDAVNNLTTWLQGLSPAWQTAIVGTVMFVAALGPVLIVAGAVVAAVGAIGATATAVIAVVAAAAVAIGVAWSENLGGIQEKTAAVWLGIKEAIGNAMLDARGIVEQAGTAISAYWNKSGALIVSTAQRVWNAVYSVVAFLVSKIVQYSTETFGIIGKWVQENLPLIQATLSTITSIVGSYFKVLLHLWENYGGYLLSFLSSIFDAIKSSVQTFIKVFLGVIKLGMQILQGDWSGAWETVKQIVYDAFWGLVGFLKGIGGALVNALKGAFAVVWDIAGWLLSKAKELAGWMIQGLVDGIKAGASLVKDAIVGVVMSPYNLVKSLLGISSPSKLYFEVGRNVALGFVLGVASLQATAQDELRRLVIPPKPETATGKGASKVNAARRKVDAKNRAAYDLLENLYRDIDALAPAEQKTRSLAVAAELAKTKYAETAQAIRDALFDAARYYDAEKANIDIESALTDQLNTTAKKLLEYKYAAKEGASETEKFTLWLQQLRAESPEASAALDRHATMIERVRKAWSEVDAAEAQRKSKDAADKAAKQALEDVNKLYRSVADIADETSAALRNVSTENDTHLERTLKRLSDVKELGLTLQQLDPLRGLSASIRDLPEPERLYAISQAIQQIVQATSGGGAFPAADPRWIEFYKNFTKAIDAAGRKDALDHATKSTTEYNRVLADLNGKLEDNASQTERARLARELETDSYKDLTRVQKDALLQRASEVDALLAQQEATKQLIDTIKGYAEAAGDAISDSLVQALTGDIRGAWDTLKEGFRNLWQTIISDLIRSGIHRALSGLLDNVIAGITGGGTAGNGGGIFGGSIGGSGGGGGIGSIITGFIGKLFGKDAASNISIPAATTGGGGGLWSNLKNVLANGGGTLANAAGTGPASTGGIGQLLSGLGGSALMAAPLIGASLGAMLGGQSGLGQMFGMAGGGIAGLGVLMGGGIAGLLNPITAIPAAILLAGAYFIGRNKQRRIEEEKRTELGGDVYNKTIQILNAARDGQMTETQAVAAFAQVESDYMAQVATFKDSKTKRHARDWFYKDFKPFYLPKIIEGARDGAKKKAFEAKFSPTFATGGGTWTKMADGGLMHSSYLGVGNNAFHGRVPGAFDAKDDRYIRVTGNEVVLRPEVWEPIEHHLIEHRVPGFPRRGFVEGGATWTDGGGGRGGSSGPAKIRAEKVNVSYTVYESEERAELVLSAMLRDEQGREAVLEIVEKDIRIKREDSRIMRAHEDVKRQA
jgi:tape measure domain-containing protein